MSWLKVELCDEPSLTDNLVAAAIDVSEDSETIFRILRIDGVFHVHAYHRSTSKHFIAGHPFQSTVFAISSDWRIK